jgi:hypothetical protein
MATPELKPELLQEAMDLVAAHGTITAAARVLGVPRSTMDHRYRKAVQGDFQPQVQALLAGDKAAPAEGLKVKGTSTLYDGDGKAKLQWVKLDTKMEELVRMQHAALKSMTEELQPIPRIAAPETTFGDLLTLYTLTDCHVGMLAWDKEAGEDWDLGIAEKCLVETFMRMIDAAPHSRVGIVNQLGDFLHFDSLQPMTPTNHHILDADSRYQKMVEVAVRILRRVVEYALTKHDNVQVYMHEGNHDPAGSVWLRVLFAQLYRDNPRVNVGMSPNPYVAYQFGRTLLGFHHGHLTKLNNLPLIFASKFPSEWGGTEYRYIHTGHKHHVEEKEHPGIKVVQHPTLAAPDAYAARGGWLSKRQATSITYHRVTGEYARGIFIPTKD